MVAFVMYDNNNNGYLSIENIKQIINDSINLGLINKSDFNIIIDLVKI